MVRELLARSGVAAALFLGIAGAGSLAAQDATPPGDSGAGLPPIPENCSVIADGLLAPRFMAVAADGTVYVTEAGIGGDEALPVPEFGDDEVTGEATPEDAPPQLEEGTPVAEDATGDEGGPPASTRGYTGQVTAVAPDGTQFVFASQFASYSDGVGPHGIAVGPDGFIYVAVGGAAVLAGLEPLEGENSIYRLDPATGQGTIVVELGSFEEENNPDGTDVNPNLYGIAFGNDGLLYVADAGGNTIYAVDVTAGAFELVAVVPGPEDATTNGETGTPVAGDDTAVDEEEVVDEAVEETLEGDATPGLDDVAAEEVAGDESADDSTTQDSEGEGSNEAGAPEDFGPRQPVPTSLAVTADGTIQVGLLSEGWDPSWASILELSTDGAFTGIANGLSTVVGLAVGPDGATYATQLTTDFSGPQPAPGNVIRVNEDGATEAVVEGLFLPHGVAFDANGSLYVATGAINLGPEGPPGQLLRCDGIAGGTPVDDATTDDTTTNATVTTDDTADDAVDDTADDTTDDATDDTEDDATPVAVTGSTRG